MKKKDNNLVWRAAAVFHGIIIGFFSTFCIGILLSGNLYDIAIMLVFLLFIAVNAMMYFLH